MTDMGRDDHPDLSRPSLDAAVGCRDEASGLAGHQPPQKQNGRAQASRAEARQPDRQAGHGADGRRGGAQAQLGRSDACRQDRQGGTEALEGGGPGEENDACSPRTVGEALGVAVKKIREGLADDARRHHQHDGRLDAILDDAEGSARTGQTPRAARLRRGFPPPGGPRNVGG